MDKIIRTTPLTTFRELRTALRARGVQVSVFVPLTGGFLRVQKSEILELIRVHLGSNDIDIDAKLSRYPFSTGAISAKLEVSAAGAHIFIR